MPQAMLSRARDALIKAAELHGVQQVSFQKHSKGVDTLPPPPFKRLMYASCASMFRVRNFGFGFRTLLAQQLQRPTTTCTEDRRLRLSRPANSICI